MPQDTMYIGLLLTAHAVIHINANICIAHGVLGIQSPSKLMMQIGAEDSGPSIFSKRWLLQAGNSRGVASAKWAIHLFDEQKCSSERMFWNWLLVWA